MAFYMKAGRGPMQKTGAGIPSALLQSTSFEDAKAKLKQRAARGKELSDQKYKELQQSKVIDSLKTLDRDGETAAAKKYGNKARAQASGNKGFYGEGLAEDASEDVEQTKRLQRASKNNKKQDRNMPLLQQEQELTFEQKKARLKATIAGKKQKARDLRTDKAKRMVLDSINLNTQGSEGKKKAAKKYGNKNRIRGGAPAGLPEDASEDPGRTEMMRTGGLISHGPKQKLSAAYPKKK